MQLKVLGSGSSGNCYLLQNKKETLIIEAGIKYREVLKGLDFNLNNVIGCLVSHEHKDHSKAISDVIKAGIDVYTSEGTALACVAVENRVKHIKSEQQFKLGDFTILPFETQHDAKEPLGFLIQHEDMGKLLFITDSYYCRYKFQGLNHIMIECNYYLPILKENIEKGITPAVIKNRLLKSHFSFEHVKEFLQANDLSNVKDIILIHLSSYNSDSEMFKTEIERLTGKPTYIAESGLQVDLW